MINYTILLGRVASPIKYAGPHKRRFTLEVGGNRFYVESDGLEQADVLRGVEPGETIFCLTTTESYYKEFQHFVKFRPVFIQPVTNHIPPALVESIVAQYIQGNIAKEFNEVNGG